MATNRNSDYAVGYAKPPRHTRFPKGRSGNPKGRPKGSKNSTTLFLEALGEEVGGIDLVVVRVFALGT